jgi:hypothetical protein
MQSWDSLRQDLLKQGYQAAAYASIHCRDHGMFRIGVRNRTARLACPTSGNICRPRFLAHGLTSRALPVIEQSRLLKSPKGTSYFKIKMASLPTASKFECEVRRRKLKLDDQKSLVNCVPLKTWAEKNRFRAYIPTELLSAWRLPVPEARVPLD